MIPPEIPIAPPVFLETFVLFVVVLLVNLETIIVVIHSLIPNVHHVSRMIRDQFVQDIPVLQEIQTAVTHLLVILAALHVLLETLDLRVVAMHEIHTVAILAGIIFVLHVLKMTHEELADVHRMIRIVVTHPMETLVAPNVPMEIREWSVLLAIYDLIPSVAVIVQLIPHAAALQETHIVEEEGSATTDFLLIG